MTSLSLNFRINTKVRHGTETHRPYNTANRADIYTDGSAYAGIMIGGTGVVITNGDTSEPTVIENIHIKGVLYIYMLV